MASVLAALVVLGALAAGHILWAKRGDDYTGALATLDHLYSLALVLALFAIGAALGGRLLRAGPRMEGPLEALLFCAAAGLATLATAILTVGLFLSVRLPALLAILAGAAFLARRELRELPSLVAGAFRILRNRGDSISLWVFLAIALFLLTRALAPPTDWDALMYHLRVPAEFLRNGKIHLPEDNAHFALVGLPHMLYLPLLALGSSAGPALVSAVFTLGLALAGFAFALRFLDERTAGLSLAVLWGSPAVVLVAMSPRTDTILAFYLFLVHYAVLRAREPKDAGFLYLAAALGGTAIGVKYNAFLYLLALAPLAAWVVITRLPKRIAAAALVSGLVLAAALPWLLKNAILLGDPVHPFFAGRTLEPWLARIYGGERLPTHLDPAAFEVVWRAQAPFNLVDLFAAPERITMEEEGVFYRGNLLLLSLPLWLLFLRRKVLGWLALPALAYAVLVVLVQPITSLRYMIPAITPLTLVALHSYGLGWDKLVSAKPARLLLSASAIFVLTETASLMVLHLTKGHQLEYVFGSASRRDFLRTWTGGYADVVSFVNERVPEGSRILMLFEARGYYFRVPVYQDNVIANWPLLSAKAAAPDCLRSAGITHVLVNRGALAYYTRRGLDLDALRLETLDSFARACLLPIYSGGGFTVFEMRGGLTSRRPPSPRRAAPCR